MDSQDCRKRCKQISRNFTLEKKIQAVQRIHSGETKASVARDLGVPESTLRGWCKNEEKLRLMYGQSEIPNIINPEASAGDTPAKRRKTADGLNNRIGIDKTINKKNTIEKFVDEDATISPERPSFSNFHLSSFPDSNGPVPSSNANANEYSNSQETTGNPETQLLPTSEPSLEHNNDHPENDITASTIEANESDSSCDDIMSSQSLSSSDPLYSTCEPIPPTPLAFIVYLLQWSRVLNVGLVFLALASAASALEYPQLEYFAFDSLSMHSDSSNSTDTQTEIPPSP